MSRPGQLFLRDEPGGTAETLPDGGHAVPCPQAGEPPKSPGHQYELPVVQGLGDNSVAE